MVSFIDEYRAQFGVDRRVISGGVATRCVFLVHRHFRFIDKKIPLVDTVLFGGRTELTLRGQPELFKQRLFGSLPLRFLFLHQRQQPRIFSVSSGQVALKLVNRR
jgi:hypothetical protein